MKKFLLLVVLVAHTISAQIISKDNTFASNGIHSITGNIAWSKMIQSSNGSIYFTYAKNNPATGLSETILSKLNPDGTTDSSFGNTGVVTIVYYSNDSQMKVQPDGKLLLYCFDSDASTNYAIIIRILPNGQLDGTFGINGVVKIPDLNPDLDARGYGLVLQNNKIIIYGQRTIIPLQDSSGKICRLNENGSIDNTFGNNGYINNFSSFILVDIDSQSNLVCFGYNKIDTVNETYVGAIAKYNNNGQPLTNFGNNGVSNLAFNPGYIQSSILDSNNHIIFSKFDPNAAGSLNKINSDGTFDASFVTNFNSSFPFLIDVLSIVEKNGYYYLGGMSYEQNNGEYFISRLTQNGTQEPVFNHFIETDPNLKTVGDMIVNDNNIIANGSGYIVRYLLSTSTLSTKDITKITHDISFENPVKQNLIFSTKEKVSKIEIYSVDGKIVKTLKDNNTDLSELLKGNYLSKITFENGKTTVKKLIKK
ncbi:hypothetical protein B0A69_02230 [Chryseobacterium shigense]|uniref:Delta-60 repeat domain-containing protein/Por secretion system C-terminal sorting domain-containing protein n=1 Tax=Chryseobacterium shigense TaxID=297244 RepID=A0A1N7I9F4_9FLAO|nr:T9SS type A sorting domain-containing protein [Chryseobacterium shigense]PQA96904.1 hypothetical protein B0A69_02230 [Chryseobacterium shigense]SIS33632.1 delta-60 repeat domain-containing protein/Por secretion system C-terminal sorting domain-containing protein [Chryseobacterium shigense]